MIRLLTGTLKISNILTTDIIDQFINYSILGRSINSPISTKSIKECVEPESNIEKLCTHLMISRTHNNEFFLDLNEEVSSYFFKKAKSSNTSGFLHLYRALEYISYSFPLIYASVDRNYHGSFNKLKNYFDTSKSELTFFNEFTKKLLDDSLLQAPLTFNFNTFSPEINRNHFNIIKSILTEENITNEMANISLTTSYQALINLTVNLRNRYFHFAVGGKRNIRSTEIVENDIFFGLINEELLNWISIIYFEILKVTIDKN